ncbi:MAG: CinA family nicotinamide mononucleotide deamidase-related protein [Planctomycetota bacterium]|nr:CinA family nicotinamide mononucleotide deamidase-related protein [Planctomycetota bacterium]
MRAAILSIGDELVAAGTIDSNSEWLAGQLASRAATTVQRRVVGDDRASIARAVGELAGVCEVLLVTGGLGPTPDDLTRAALGDVLAPGRPLESDPVALQHLNQWFKKRPGEMPTSNLAQAQRPQGTRSVPNPLGTAMGIAGRLGECMIFAMPGPPHEMQTMFLDQVLPQLPLPDAGQVVLTAGVHAYGLAESMAAERIGPITARDSRPLVGITVSESIVTARIQAKGPLQQAERELENTASLIMRQWQPYAFGRDDDSLSSAVGSLLRESNRTLTTAESCTGGLLGKMLVDVAGSSAYYVGGWVTYTDALKTSCLGVPQQVLQDHGAVSEPAVCAMAEGALAGSGADYSLAITGIAGPDGGSTPKPVGTVYVGLGQSRGAHVTVSIRRFEFPGDRSAIRDRAAKTALQMLRFVLLDSPASTALLWEDSASVDCREC